MSTDIFHIQQQRTADVLSGPSSPSEVNRFFDGESSPKLPTPEMLEVGEIALNIAKDYEVIAIKNSDGEIVYIPFNIALKLLETKQDISELSGYTYEAVERLSGDTEAVFENLEQFKVEIAERIIQEISSLSASTQSLVEAASAALNEKINSLSGYTSDSVVWLEHLIYELSGNTDSKIEDVREYIDYVVSVLNEVISDVSSGSTAISGDVMSLSAYTEHLISELSASTDSKIEELSASTKDGFDEVNGRIDGLEDELHSLSGKVETFSAKTEADISELSATTDERISELSASTDYRIIELSASTDTRITELSASTDTRITELSASTDSRITELSASTDTRISELSASTDTRISELSASTDTRITELSASTDSRISELSASTDSRISELSASTDSRLEEVNNYIDNLNLGDLHDVTLEEKTLEPGTIEFLSRSGSTWTNTEIPLTDISGTTEAIEGLRDNLEEIELVHAAAFKKFREATGVDENVQYNPQWKYLEGMNMSQAIDFVGESVEDNYGRIEGINGNVIDNELTTAAAVARINRSLGFNNNAIYEPESDDFYGMTVTETIDCLKNGLDEIQEYIDVRSTKDHVIVITYEKLLSLVQAKKLLWGCMYRISNYQATVNSAFARKLGLRQPNVKSGVNTNNGFEITVTAINSYTLSEDAIFSRSTYNESFKNCRVESWTGKYTIFNDKNRYAWADEDGYGVIYYLKDEYGNEAWYDFKDIMILDGEGQKHFTFENAVDGSDLTLTGNAYGNKLGLTLIENKQAISCVRFSGSKEELNTIDGRCINTTFNGNLSSCIVGTAYSGITLTGDYSNSLIGYNII